MADWIWCFDRAKCAIIENSIEFPLSISIFLLKKFIDKWNLFVLFDSKNDRFYQQLFYPIKKNVHPLGAVRSIGSDIRRYLLISRYLRFWRCRFSMNIFCFYHLLAIRSMDFHEIDFTKWILWNEMPEKWTVYRTDVIKSHSHRESPSFRLEQISLHIAYRSTSITCCMLTASSKFQWKTMPWNLISDIRCRCWRCIDATPPWMLNYFLWMKLRIFY